MIRFTALLMVWVIIQLRFGQSYNYSLSHIYFNIGLTL